MPGEDENEPSSANNGTPFAMSIPLPRLSSTGDLKPNWEKFRQLWDSYEILTGLKQKGEPVRVATFIQAIGIEFLDTHNNLPYKEEADKQKLDEILKLWDEHAKGKVNVIYERHVFNSYVQTEESLGEFIVNCKHYAQNCEYGTLKDELVRDRIVTGTKHQDLKQRLLNQEHTELTLDKCVQMCKTYDATKCQMKAMGDKNSSVHGVSQNYRKSQYIANCRFCGKGHERGITKCFAFGKVCERCNRANHVASCCPENSGTKPKQRNRPTSADASRAKGSGQSSFYKHRPKHKYNSKHRKSRPSAHAVEADDHDIADSATDYSSDDTSYDHDACMISVEKSHASVSKQNSNDDAEVHNVHDVKHDNKKYEKKIVATMELAGNPYPVTMQVDSGAECNVLPERFLPAGSIVNKTSSKLRLYNSDTKIDILGVTNLTVRNPKNDEVYSVPFNVVQGQRCLPLLGAYTSQVMGLIKVRYQNIAPTSEVNVDVDPDEWENVQTTSMTHDSGMTKEDILNTYSEVFEGLGCLPGLVHLETRDDVSPVVMPPRRVPLAVRPKLQAELQRLEKLGVIKKVECTTDWVSSLCVTEKPSGKIRVCIDPLHLNTALKRCHYPLPVIEDILPDLSRVKVFSKADCREGFLQCVLDEESSYLTTFQSPWGRYRWTRLAFGLTPSPEIFQMKLDQCLEGLKGIHKIADDILITGEGSTIQEAQQDHDRNLDAFLKRCKDKHIRLNKDKFDYKCEEVRFIGHTLTRHGLKPDMRKVEAILKMPEPTDLNGVQRFLGMTKYLAKFLPELSHETQPIRKLTHKDAEFNWTAEQDLAFQVIKEKVSSTPILRYFDHAVQLEGQGDASDHGLGFSLLQDGQPITYASRALTAPETRYSQIEKELLAQVFGLQHNHMYTYGRKVVLWTDHKPLVMISRKPLSAAPKRLQRLLLALHNYDVDIRYKPGKEMFLADTLSRAYLNTNHASSQVETETEMVNMCESVPISPESYADIKEATAQDDTLQAVKHLILTGWPDHLKQCTQETAPYFDIRDELSYQDGVIFRGTRVIVPRQARPVIRQRLHRAHMGANSTIRRAKECVYWPGIAADLRDYISKCELCNSYKPQQQKETLISHELPDRPWQKIGVDIFTLDSCDYLCCVDYYSDYFEVDRLHKKDANAIMKILQRHFTTHGIPETVFSDNGPPFNSKTFEQFAKDYQFTHQTSSPEYPQSNGKVEATIKIAKNLMKKSKKADGNFKLALLEWRNIPTEGLNSSPAQRFFGRRTRTLLPIKNSLLKPELQTKVKEKKRIKQNKQERFYNRGAKELPALEKGDTVRIKPRATQRDTVWEKARVIEQVEERSYRVETEDGRTYIRNRRHLRLTNEPFHRKPVDTETRHIPSSVLKDHTPLSAQRNSNLQRKSQVAKSQTRQPPVRHSTRERRQPAYLKDYVQT